MCADLVSEDMRYADICLSKDVPLAKLPLDSEGMIALISGEWENR